MVWSPFIVESGNKVIVVGKTLIQAGVKHWPSPFTHICLFP